MLLDWLDEAALDRVGCFRYEPVAGATSNDLAAPVPKEVIEERWHRFMERQQAISKKRLKRKVGTRQQVIIDEVGPTVAKGRSKGDAPEIDGAVYVASRRPLRVGEIATVKIERADEYDLHGTAVGLLSRARSLRLEAQLLHQLLLLGDGAHHEGAIVRGVQIERLLVDLGHRLDIGRLVHALLEGVVQDLHHLRVHALGSRQAERRVRHHGDAGLLQRRHGRPALAALVAPDHQQAQAARR